MRFSVLLCIILTLYLISCNKSKEHQESNAITVESFGEPTLQQQWDSKTEMADQELIKDAQETITSTQEVSSSSAKGSIQTTRQNAYDQAFKSGVEMGRYDGPSGVHQGYEYASVYTDDWIRQAFIQGYEYGFTMAGGYEVVEDEYYEDEYYYEDDW